MRMRNVLFSMLPLLAVLLMGCAGTPTNGETAGEKTGESAISISTLLSEGATYVGKEVMLAGEVEHVCRHSGKRCFLTDADGTSVRVEAAGDIAGFAEDLIGNRIVVRGIVREFSIPAERIDAMEAELEKRAAEGAEEEHCDAQRNSIEKMRTWMTEHGKDAYVLYYVEGLSYEVEPK